MPRRPNPGSHEPERLSAAQKALRIIEAVAVARGPLSLVEIERVTGLSRPTTHRLTSSLIDLGYIERDEVLRQHVEGPKLITLAIDVLRSSAPRGHRRDILTGIAGETGEACHFSLLRGSQVLLIDQAQSPAPLGVRFNSDHVMPAHCTASGKLLLALLADEPRNAILATLPLSSHTDRTITDRRRLTAALSDIRKSGVGTEEDEYIAGVAAVAVPVKVAGGQVVGALSLTAPHARIGLTQAMRFVPALKQAATRLAATFNMAAAGR